MNYIPIIGWIFAIRRLSKAQSACKNSVPKPRGEWAEYQATLQPFEDTMKALSVTLIFLGIIGVIMLWVLK